MGRCSIFTTVLSIHLPAFHLPAFHIRHPRTDASAVAASASAQASSSVAASTRPLRYFRPARTSAHARSRGGSGGLRAQLSRAEAGANRTVGGVAASSAAAAGAAAASANSASLPDIYFGSVPPPPPSASDRARNTGQNASGGRAFPRLVLYYPAAPVRSRVRVREQRDWDRENESSTDGSTEGHTILLSRFSSRLKRRRFSQVLTGSQLRLPILSPRSSIPPIRFAIPLISPTCRHRHRRRPLKSSPPRQAAAEADLLLQLPPVWSTPCAVSWMIQRQRRQRLLQRLHRWPLFRYVVPRRTTTTTMKTTMMKMTMMKTMTETMITTTKTPLLKTKSRKRSWTFIKPQIQ